jgi:alpha-tubulin suppressor-like RCC1 family protein
VLDSAGGAWIFGRTPLGTQDQVIWEDSPKRISAEELGAPRGTTFVSAALGRNHMALVGGGGEVWTAGVNSVGQVRN